MTARVGLAIALVVILGACAVPQGGCQSAAQSELRALDSKITEITRDMARGYSVQPEQLPETRLSLCAWPKEPVLFCTQPIRDAQPQRRVPVDPAASARELAALQAQRAALVDRIAQAPGQCS